MASKGQKFSNYNDNDKFEIIRRYKNGESGYQLAKEYEITVGTVKMREYKIDYPQKIIGNKKGRPKEKDLTKEDYKERYEIIKKYKDFFKIQREKK